MQITLFSLLISFVLVGAALAALGPWGGAVVAAMLLGSVAIIRGSTRPWQVGAKVGCVLMIGLWGLVVYLGCSDPSEGFRHLQCLNNQKQIVWALTSYHEQHGCYPPAYIQGPDGKPWHSWRVLILPYLDCDSLYQQYDFNEPWDGPHNRKLVTEAPGVFLCPSNSRRPNTSYLAVIGQQAAWLGETSRQMSDFRDAAATIQLVEVSDSGISWMEPRDVVLDDLLKAKDEDGHPLILSVHSGRKGNVAMADGLAHTLPGVLSTDVLRALLVIEADKKGVLEAAMQERTDVATREDRKFLIQLGILAASTLVLLLRSNPRWKKTLVPSMSEEAESVKE